MPRSLRRGELLLVLLVVAVLTVAVALQWREVSSLPGLYRAPPGGEFAADLSLLESGAATLRWERGDGASGGLAQGSWRQTGDVVELELDGGRLRLRIEQTPEGLALAPDPESATHPALGSSRLTQVLRWPGP